MSRIALFFGLALMPAAASAQVSEATLQHRIAVLTAKQAVLQRQLKQRDSLAVAGADLVVIGRSPLCLRVPRWVAPATSTTVAAVVDSWAVRVGPLFAAAPPETLVVMMRSDTGGWSRAQLASLVTEFPDLVVFNARRGAEARVDRALGGRMVAWLGNASLPAEFDRGRREAIVALTGDTTGTGSRCLDGDAVACATVLAYPDPRYGAVRASLLAEVVEQGGAKGWERLAADTSAAVTTRLEEAGGVAYPQLVAAWIERLRSPATLDSAALPGETLLALTWAVGLLLLFLWGLTWHRA